MLRIEGAELLQLWLVYHVDMQWFNQCIAQQHVQFYVTSSVKIMFDCNILKLLTRTVCRLKVTFLVL